VWQKWNFGAIFKAKIEAIEGGMGSRNPKLVMLFIDAPVRTFQYGAFEGWVST